MTIPERAAQIAVQIANDDRHGYSQANRYGTLEGGDFDCSSLVIYCYHRAFLEAGVSPTPQNAGASYTGNMLAGFTRCGFKALRDDHGAGLRVGDVLLNEARHTAIVCSVNPVKLVNARGDMDGVAGDSTGTEIRIQPYWSYPWDWVLRYEPNTAVKEVDSATNSSGIGQQMAEKIVSSRDWPTLKLYSKGKWVIVLQALLNAKGDYGLEVDGDFGVFTYSAVNKFQSAHGLERDGIVGKETWGELKK